MFRPQRPSMHKVQLLSSNVLILDLLMFAIALRGASAVELLMYGFSPSVLYASFSSASPGRSVTPKASIVCLSLNCSLCNSTPVASVTLRLWLLFLSIPLHTVQTDRLYSFHNEGICGPRSLITCAQDEYNTIHTRSS